MSGLIWIQAVRRSTDAPMELSPFMYLDPSWLFGLQETVWLNGLDPEPAPQNVGPGLDPSRSTL